MGVQAERAARFFREELALITKQSIKDFVLQCFDTICPDYFWERAASKNGFYHPQFVSGQGGLARHVKYGAFWVTQLCRSACGTGQNDDVGPDHDVCLAAMLLHDVVKDGDPGRTIPKSTHKIARYHGVEMAEAIYHRVLGARVLDPKNPDDLDKILIMYGVAAHMGVWTEPEKFRPWNLEGSHARKVATVVHLADYCASRKVDEVIPRLNGLMP